MNPDPPPHLHADFTDAAAARMNTDPENSSREEYMRKDAETRRKKYVQTHRALSLVVG